MNIRQFLPIAKQEAEEVDGLDAHGIMHYQMDNLRYQNKFRIDINDEESVLITGVEAVFEDDKPIWSLGYHAEAKDGSAILCLLDAQKYCCTAVPIRGTSQLIRSDYTYFNDMRGSLNECGGIEKVLINHKQVLIGQYCGGTI